jgi:hypothetical protein
MKVLISNDTKSAHYYIRMGIAKALTACNHSVIMWDIHKKAVNDAFDEFEPDLFIGQTYNVNRVLRNAIDERPHMKVVMKASEWGTVSDKINLQQYPILVANDREKREILSLHERTGKPDYIFVHYHPDAIPETHAYWIKYGIRAEAQLNAADIFEFTRGQIIPEFRSDIAFAGGYWPYKAVVLDKYLMPICRRDEYNIKIYGNSTWPTKAYCGFIPDQYIKHAFHSATICPNLHEPHSQEFGYDIIERPFKLLSNKCFVISDSVFGLKDLIPNGIVYADSPDQFSELIDYFIKHPEERDEYIQDGYITVMNNHTYFHRIREMFTRLNMLEEASRVDKAYQGLIKKLQL